ncbi:MAG: hypothetical protein ACSLE6_20285 [Mycobacterium sp.]
MSAEFTEPRTPGPLGAARTRTVTWHDPGPGGAAALALAGIDYLNAMIDSTRAAARVGQRRPS